jgi:hypothetical protein
MKTTAFLIALLLATPALALDRANPDWPCPQRKVPKLSVGQVWDGPSIDGLDRAKADAGVNGLVEKLASRRVPVEEAMAAIKDYAKSLPEPDRNAKLTLAFALLFDRVNSERSTVLDGIERFEKRQKGRSAELEREGTRIAKLKESPPTDDKGMAELTQAAELYDWNVRVFQERQSSMPIACEIPTLMEQRLYELAREIRANMKG